jgi:hypothetical protein
MFGVILVYHHLVVYMNLLIHNLDIFFHMVKLEKMLESSYNRLFTFSKVYFNSSRNLVVALKELSIRGDFHSTGKTIYNTFCQIF